MCLDDAQRYAADQGMLVLVSNKHGMLRFQVSNERSIIAFVSGDRLVVGPILRLSWLCDHYRDLLSCDVESVTDHIKRLVIAVIDSDSYTTFLELEQYCSQYDLYGISINDVNGICLGGKYYTWYK